MVLDLKIKKNLVTNLQAEQLYETFLEYEQPVYLKLCCIVTGRNRVKTDRMVAIWKNAILKFKFKT